MTLIDSATPAVLADDGMSPDEQRKHDALHAHRALGLLIARVPLDMPIGEWCIRAGGIECLANPKWNATDDEIRDFMRRLAKAVDMEYAERRHSNTQNMVAATGEIEGVHVRLWQLVKPCTCSCHSAVTE